MPKCNECIAYGIDDLSFSGCLIRNTMITMKDGKNGCYKYPSTIAKEVSKVKNTEPRSIHYKFLNEPVTSRYRCESFRGSGIRDIADVIKFEVLELNNVDILLYIKDTYFYHDPLKYDIDKFIKLLFCGRNIDLRQECDELVDDIIKTIKKMTKKDIKYCVWLSDLDDVVELYGKEDIYKIDTSNIILSDLGKDGTLYAYEELPEFEYMGV